MDEVDRTELLHLGVSGDGHAAQTRGHHLRGTSVYYEKHKQPTNTHKASMSWTSSENDASKPSLQKLWPEDVFMVDCYEQTKRKLSCNGRADHCEMEEKPPHCQDHADKAKLVNVQHLEAERSTSQQGRGLHMASRETFPLFPSDTTPPRSGCANKRSFRPRLIPSKGEREAGANHL
ncbi:hypothetical protein JZ751_013545, partial [Albula glossodonta]